MRKANYPYVALLFAILTCAQVWAHMPAAGIDTLRPASQIESVTVFTSGALVTRQLGLTLKAGQHFLLLQGLPLEIDPASIEVKSPDACTVLSVKHFSEVKAQAKKSASYLKIEDEIQAQKRQLKAIKQEAEVYGIEESILLDNSSLKGKEASLSVEEIKQAADFYRSRLNEIRRAIAVLDIRAEEKLEQIKKLQSSLGVYETARHKRSSELLIRLRCKEAFKDSLRLRYYCPSAGWSPSYDLRVTEVKAPLQVGYNASIYQNTGEDWNEVQLKLSSGNPRLSGEKPELEDWRIGRHAPRIQANTAGEHSQGEVRGKCTDEETGEALPFVNIVIKRGDQFLTGATSDFDGNFVIKPIPSGTYDLQASYVGYTSKLVRGLSVKDQMITFQNLELESSVKLDAFEIVEYKVPLIDRDGGASGSAVRRDNIARMPGRSAASIDSRGARQTGSFYYVDGIRVRGSSEQALEEQRIASLVAEQLDLALRENVAHREYPIEEAFSVRSDGRDYQVIIQELEVSANYVYHLIPKLDSDAFLTAQIADWASLQLLPGPAAVYYRGTFTGYTRLDPEYTGDTLQVSLGRDRSIVVQRSGQRELNDRQFVGNKIRESQHWKLSMRNNHPSKVKVILYDQFPISEIKSVQVDLQDHDGAVVDERRGVLQWEIDLPGNALEERHFSYELRYPQGSLSMLR